MSIADEKESFRGVGSATFEFTNLLPPAQNDKIFTDNSQWRPDKDDKPNRVPGLKEDDFHSFPAGERGGGRRPRVEMVLEGGRLQFRCLADFPPAQTM